MCSFSPNVLCVVPARGGSKSIPGKNLKKVGGISLVARAAIIAKSLDDVTRAIISTDSEEIGKEGIAFGLECPFMRPDDLAQDDSSSVDMWINALLMAEEYYSERYDYTILLEPTSPMRRTGDVQKTLNLLFEGHSAAMTVSKVPAHFSPEKALITNAECKLQYYIGEEGRNFHNRQTIPDYFHRNGICYAVERNQLIKKRNIIEGAFPVVIDRPVINIDEQHELDLANVILESQENQYV